MIATESEQWRPLLVGWLYRRGAADPEDLAAETLARCWLAEQRGQTICKSFAFTIARNLLYDEQRRRKFHADRPIEDFNLTVEDAGAEDIPDQDYVARLLAQLTERQRQVLLLTAEGLPQEQIAERLGTSVNAVKKLKERGILQARVAA